MNMPKLVTFLLSDLKKVRLDGYVWILIAIYSSCFISPILIMNDINYSLLSTLCVDHASMLDSMVKILNRETLYNQMAGYHSSYYGWTYFFISFWFLLPVKIVTWALGCNPYLPIFISLKILHFIYGMLAVISFYFLMTKVANKFHSLLFALILALASPLTYYIYIIHPETIGVLFLNLGSIYIINCWRHNNYDNNKELYYSALLFLVLATLAKPTFFLITTPLYICLLVIYSKKSSWPLLELKDTGQLVLKSFCFAITVFFIVNPFFFFNFKQAIDVQLENIAAHSHSRLTLATWNESIASWASVISTDLVMAFSILSSVMLLLYLLLDRRLSNFLRNIFLFSQVSVLIAVFFIVFKMRLFIMLLYLIPLLPPLLISFYLVISWLIKNLPLPSKVSEIVLMSLLIAVALPSIKVNATNMIGFYDYKNNLQYKVYMYIKDDMPNGSIIAHDHLVAIPDGKNLQSYHYWQHSKETLIGINLDYIIFDPELKINNHYQDNTVVLRGIIKKGWRKITNIDNIEVWKKKDS